MRRGQSGQSRPGLPDASRSGGAWSMFRKRGHRSFAENATTKESEYAPIEPAASPRNRRRRRRWRPRRRPLAAAPRNAAGIAGVWRSRGSRARGGALGRVAADLRLQLDDVEEDVGLAAQLVGDHWRLRRDGGDHGHAHAAPLHRLDQRAEVAVAREQHHVVDRAGDLHGIDGKLDVHVALDLAPAGLIDEFLGRLGHDAVAVVVEPVDQRPDRRIFLILDHGSVIEGPQEIAARVKLAQQPLVVDIEPERLGGGIEIGAVNEQCDFFRSWVP